MPSRRTFLRTLGASGSTAIAALAGCQGGAGADEEPTTSAAPTATDEPSAQETTTTAPPTTTETGPSVTFGGDQEINMSLSPSVPQQDLYVQYAPLRDYLEQHIESDYDVPEAIDAQYNIGSNYSAVIQALGAGTADIAETGPFAAALGVLADKAEIVIQRKGYGSWEYTSTIAVAPDSDIGSLSDLSGKRVAFSDRLSTSGALYPLYDIKTEGGVDIGTLPEGNGARAEIEPIWAGGHVDAYALLKEGQADAAGMGAFVPGIVDNFEANAEILHEHDGLPRAPIVVSPELDDAAANALTEAFLEAPQEVYYGANGEEGGDDDLWFSDVREADIDRYQSVIDVARELGVGADYFETVGQS